MGAKISVALSSVSLALSLGHILYRAIVPRVQKRRERPPVEIMKDAVSEVLGSYAINLGPGALSRANGDNSPKAQ